MDFTGKPGEYRIGYAHGLCTAVVAIGTTDARGAPIPKDFDRKNDPEADYALGYIDGMERGVDLMRRAEASKRRWFD